MQNVFNQLLFEQVNLDSGALTMKDSIVHTVHEEGIYHGQTSRGSDINNFFLLQVSKDFPDKQVYIDLNSLEGKNGSPQAKNSFTLAPGGLIIFYVADGVGGYAVNLIQAGERSLEKPFNSRELKEEDIFTASLLRPGLYMAKNQKNNTSMELVVPYPRRITKKPVLRTTTIECTDKGMSPAKVEVQAGAGIIFLIKTTARILIELQHPIDRPELYSTPDDVPRSVERKVLAVLNSSMHPDFLAGFLETGKGHHVNQQVAAKIFESKQKTGRIDSINTLFEVEKLKPEEYTKMINSLDDAFNQLTDRSKMKRNK